MKLKYIDENNKECIKDIKRIRIGITSIQYQLKNNECIEINDIHRCYLEDDNL